MKKSKPVVNAAKELPDWQVRVFQEKARLDEKIAKLNEAVRVSVLKNAAQKAGFDDETTLELLEQLIAMEEYSAALARRILRF